MRDSETNPPGESAEQQLRRRIEELERQLRERKPAAHAGAPAERWRRIIRSIDVALRRGLVPRRKYSQDTAGAKVESESL